MPSSLPPLILLLSILPSTTPALNITSHIVPLNTQRHISSVSEWFNLLTLCIAPLATHLVFGIGEPFVLAGRHPRPTDRITHFNPVSITWRYFAIADRRLRAKCWDPADMAACNAAFWTGERWDGSEEMMIASRQLATLLPEKPFVSILSGSGIATVVMALQGVQAVAMIMFGAMSSRSTHDGGLAALFSPLAILGFSRLIPALWISDQYSYAQSTEGSLPHKPDRDGYAPVAREADRELAEVTRDMVLERLHPVSSLRGFVFRGFAFWMMTAGTGLSVMSMLRGIVWQYPGGSASVTNQDSTITTSGALQIAMYLVLVLGIFFIHTAHISSGSTVIPCIGSLWYKLYTYLLILLAVAAFVVGAIETRVIPCGELCGKYTTLPKEFDGCS